MDKITALIRYKNSAETLPEVLKAIHAQTRVPESILGIDTGSTDGSSDLLREAGADIVEWDHPYHASKVLNFGISSCETPLIFCLSSHTVMHDPETVQRLAGELKDHAVCAASVKWDQDPYYTDKITWSELVEKGIKFGSIYTNSLGLFRRSLWEDYPFADAMTGIEDYDWALHQLKSGHSVARIAADFSYKRNGHNREMDFAARAFHLANQYGLDLKWLGVGGALRGLVQHLPGRLRGDETATTSFQTCKNRLLGKILWRHYDFGKDKNTSK